MTDLEILKSARAKLASGWVDGSRAVDSRHFYVEPWSPSAVKWCALGAVDAVVGKYADRPDAHLDLIEKLAKFVPKKYGRSVSCVTSVAAYSNMAGQEAALSMFDQAIQEVENG